MQTCWSWLLVLAALTPAYLPGADWEAAPRAQGANATLAAQNASQLESKSAGNVPPGGSDALAQLTGGVTSGGEFLPPEQAFRLSVDVKDADALIARWQIADGYYLYRDKMRFALQDVRGVSLSKIALPAGIVEEDEFFGRVEIYPEDIEVTLPLERAGGEAQRVTVKAQYQGCAEAGLCYPPMTRELTVELPTVSAGGRANSTSSFKAQTKATPGAQVPPLVQSEQDRLAGQLAAGGLWLNIAVFFGAGLLLAFTPCVFPMIPILSGVIAGQPGNITTRKAFALSLTFVLVMAVTYTVAGVVVGLSGENVQAVFQNPWVLSLFAGVFVALALSMFGFYELQMPAAVQSRLAAFSRRQESGTFIGAGIMGLLSALIVGPCVTAPLIGALLYIAQTGDALLGGVALFALSMGMGAPLLVIGTSAGRLMPKAGPWMETVKAIFGVLLLAVAIWLLERILPAPLTMALWALLLIVSGIYLGAFDAIRESASGWYRLWKGLGIAMSIYGALLLVGAAGGGHDVLQPLKGIMAAVDQTRSEGLEFRPIKGPAGLQQAVADARAQGRPVMLDFYADWCVACKEMEKYTFSDAAVQAALKRAVLLQADVTGNDAQDRALLKSLELFGPPAILFYTPEGQERRAFRVVGFMPAEAFSRHVTQALQSDS
jgi:thioredoxin:protein disulfide reductase